MSEMEVDKNMIEASNPLSAFFHAVMNELRKRLSHEEFVALLKDCQEAKTGQ